MRQVFLLLVGAPSQPLRARADEGVGACHRQ
jgi:hypothetical protein